MKSAGEEKILNQLGQQLRALRLARGFSLRQLGDEADIAFSEVHRIEKGQRNPSFLILVAISKALKVEVAELVRF